jgi:hypothetical protein
MIASLPTTEGMEDDFVYIRELSSKSKEPSEQEHPEQEHPDQEHPDQEHPDQEHPDQEHPDQEHLDQALIQSPQLYQHYAVPNFLRHHPWLLPNCHLRQLYH